MWYLGNHLTDFDEICMTVHISRSDPIGNQKFESQIVDCSNLKNRKKSDISYVQFWQNFAWWCRFGLQALGLT